METALRVGFDPGLLSLETQVEVRSRFDQRWARGFEVAGVHDGRYLVRRRSDGVVLAGDFSSEEVRPDLR